MTSGKSEHERIVDLEQALPNLAAQVVALGVRISSVEDLGRSPSGVFQAAGPGALGTPAFPLFPGASLLGCFSAAELSAQQAGEAVTQMEDVAEDLELDLADLLKDPGATISDVEKANQQTARMRLVQALADARAAKNKVAGAATAAKKFGAAQPHIMAAEDSFNQAAKKLREFDRTVEFPAKSQKLRDAQTLIKDDIDKLKAALAAITA